MDERRSGYATWARTAVDDRRARAACTSTTGSGDPTTRGGPGLPWIGIFLLVFGGLLLVQQAYPELESASSLLVLAIGLAFLVKWAIDRGTGSLYAGSIITALAAPGVLNAAGVEADGLGTFSLGVAFLFIAAVRAASGGGWGWQLWFGGLLALIGGVNISSPAVGDLLVPVLLVAPGGGDPASGCGPRHWPPVSGWQRPAPPGRSRSALPLVATR